MREVKPVDFAQFLNTNEVYYEAVKQMSSPLPSVDCTKDWPIFNGITGGFRPREFTILCGSTGSGKTAWLAGLSAQLLKQDIHHFVMSVETGHTDFMLRVLSVLEGEDLNDGNAVPLIRAEEIAAKYIPMVNKGMLKLSLYDNRVSVEQLCADLKYMAGLGCKIAMIDNLNFFMEVTRAADQVIEMDRVIHELIILCKTLDMHVIMVMHPKKTDHGRIESEFDIKGSSTAVQEAHNVLLFNRPSREDLERGTLTPFHRELKIQKMRRRGGFVGARLIYAYENCRYIEEACHDVYRRHHKS